MARRLAHRSIRFAEVMINWAKKTVQVVSFTALSDPEKKIPFPIVNNDTKGLCRKFSCVDD